MDYTWQAGVDGNWSTAGNWSPTGVPGGDPTDNVSILTAGAGLTVTFDSGLANINALFVSANNRFAMSDGSLTIGGSADFGADLAILGGTLALNGASTVESLETSAGTLMGAGTLNVTGGLTDTSITLLGIQINLAAGSTTAISGVSDLDDGAVFENQGTLNMTGGQLALGAGDTQTGAMIENLAGATFNLSNSANIVDQGGSNQFANAGTLNADSASISVTVSNTGTLSVRDGGLDLQESFLNHGAVTLSANATLTLDGGGEWDSGSTLSAAAGSTLQLTGNTFTVNASGFSLGGTLNLSDGSVLDVESADATVRNLIADGDPSDGIPSIVGSGHLTVSGTATLDALVMDGSGTTLLGGTTTVSSLTLQGGRVLENQGTLTVDPGQFIVMTNATITNDQGATFNFTSGGVHSGDFEATNSFENDGQLNAAGDFTEIAANLTNSATGAIDVGAASTLQVDLTFNNAGSVRLENGATLDLMNGGSAGTIDFAGSNAVLGVASPDATTGLQVQNFGHGDGITFVFAGYESGETATYDGTQLQLLDPEGSNLATLNVAGLVLSPGETLAVVSDANGDPEVEEGPCFLRGTRILTPQGEVPVENLKMGDLVVTDGMNRPIRWIGRRHYSGWSLRIFPDLAPIRFPAGVLGKGLPRRDLWVSPEHAMFIDGMLIPASALVNGESIVQDTTLDEVTYFHLEFDAHAILFAEGAASESFVDDQSRHMFDNADEFARLYPNHRHEPARFCAPRVEDGWELETVRARLTRRSQPSAPRRGRTASAI